MLAFFVFIWYISIRSISTHARRVPDIVFLRKRGFIYLINTYERQRDILKLISQFDISMTMYKNADEKYHAVARFLEDCDIKADIYPQGSFAFGTVLRPSTKDPDANYDLDFICQLHATRDNIAPSELQKKIENVLSNSSRYGEGKLTVYPECFTIEYADINGVGFTIDIVPAVDESPNRKLELMGKSPRPDLLHSAIAIPIHNGERNYRWLTNNPIGFKKWFDEINRPFLDSRKTEIRKALFEENRAYYNSIEEIPAYMERSSIQRVIQILKFHRNEFYKNLPDGDAIKPISAIINTLVTDIARTASPTLGIFELLNHVLFELSIYAHHQNMHHEAFENEYGSRVAITHKDGKWEIQNPANPEDNLANKWNQNPDIPKYFFLWIAACTNDLITSLSLSDSTFRASMDNAFGAENIKKSWGTKYKSVTPKPIIPTKAARPYRF